jgi:hypothetical protein
VTLLNAPPGANDRRWTSVRTPLHACTPSIAMRLDGQPATLVLDYGADGTLVNEDVFNSIGKNLQRLDTVPVSFVGGEPLRASRYVIPHASAGSLQFGPLDAWVTWFGEGQSLKNDGLLGRNVLDNYRLILDYAHDRTYFQKHPDWHAGG